MVMKHKRIRPIWKFLFFFTLFGIGYYFFLIKDFKKEDTHTSSVTTVKKNVNNKKNTNANNSVVNNNTNNIKEEEVVDVPVVRYNTGLYSVTPNEVFNITNIYLTNNRTYFKLSENITIYMEGSMLDYAKGEIYITPHNDSESIYYTLEYDYTNFSSGINFNINFEEHDLGYYDIHVMNNNMEVGLFVFQIGE